MPDIVVVETITFTESPTSRVGNYGCLDQTIALIQTLSSTGQILYPYYCSGGPPPPHITEYLGEAPPTQFATTKSTGLPSGSVDADLDGMDIPAASWELSCDGATCETATVELTLPMITISSGENIADEDAEVDTTLPMLTLSTEVLTGMVAEGLIDLPPPTLSATTAYGAAGEIEWDLPYFTMDASDVYSGMILPMLQLECDGYTGAAGELETSLPALQITCSGIADQEGIFECTLQPFSGYATATASVVGDGANEIPTPVLEASGYTVNDAGADLELPVLTIEAEGIVTNLTATAGITLPMFLVEAASSFESAQSNQGIVAINLSNNAVSEYSNFEFTGFFTTPSGQVFGVAADGIYLIEGEDDAGEEIETEVEKTGVDMGSPFYKRTTDVYMKYESKGDILFEMKADNKSKPYVLNDGIEGVKTEKLEPGKGMKGRNLGFNIKNLKGSTMRMEEILMIVEILKRRAHGIR